MDWDSLPVIPDGLYLTPVTATAQDNTASQQRMANSARRAISEHQITTTGTGNIRPGAELTFKVVFLEEPQFTYGSAILRHPDPVGWHDPFSSAIVRSWVLNKNGYYTGVRLAYHIDMDANTSTSLIPPAVKVVHFLTFSGLAYKEIQGIDTELSDMTPHQLEL